MHQVNLSGNRKIQDLAQPVADNLGALFEGITVTPSTLHGDLWSGNIASVDGQPAVFDPAVYLGHSEADFGMSWCAGFSRAFYDAYFEVLPKQHGFDARRDLYLVRSLAPNEHSACCVCCSSIDRSRHIIWLSLSDRDQQSELCPDLPIHFNAYQCGNNMCFSFCLLQARDLPFLLCVMPRMSAGVSLFESLQVRRLCPLRPV
jgi:Fructosamine kinase